MERKARITIDNDVLILSMWLRTKKIRLSEIKECTVIGLKYIFITNQNEIQEVTLENVEAMPTIFNSLREYGIKIEVPQE